MNNCPVCDSKKIKGFVVSRDSRNITNKVYKYIECEDCGVLRLPIKPTLKYYDNNYGKKYYSNVNKYRVKGYFEAIYSKFINSQKLKLIINSIGNKKKLNILDVGSGNLNFLRSIYDLRFEKYAIDIYKSKENVRTIKIINGDFLKHDFKAQKFDVVTSWHVIEHIGDPRKFLEKIYQLLKDDGIAIISTPNLDSLGFKWFKKNWYHLDAPRHLVLFNELSLMQLSQKTGFDKLANINMFYEFPFDLFHSARKANWLGRIAMIIFYPFLKIFDRETSTLILKK